MNRFVLADMLKISPIPMESANRCTETGWMLEVEKVLNECLQKIEDAGIEMSDPENFGPIVTESVQKSLDDFLAKKPISDLLEDLLRKVVNAQLVDIIQDVKIVKDRMKNHINVVANGVENDGSVDVSDKINDLGAYASSHGMDLYFPAGTYRCDKDIYLYSNMNFLGDNRKSKIVFSANCNAQIKNYGFDTNQGIANSGIYHMSIVHKDELHVSAIHSISMRGSRNIRIMDNYIENAPFSSVGGSSCIDVWVERNTFYKSGQGCVTFTGGRRIYVNYNVVNSTKIVNNHNVRPIGIDMGEGCEEYQIIGNSIYDVQHGLYIRDGSRDVVIKDNIIKDCSLNGITIIMEERDRFTYSLKDAVIEGNVIRDCIQHGIVAYNMKDTIIGGNKISGIGNDSSNIANYGMNQGVAISLPAYDSNVTLDGNLIYNIATAGIVVGTTSEIVRNCDVVAENNTLSGCSYVTDNMAVLLNGECVFKDNTIKKGDILTNPKGIVSGYNNIIHGNIIKGFTTDIDGQYVGGINMNSLDLIFGGDRDLDFNSKNVVGVKSILMNRRLIINGDTPPSDKDYYRGTICFNNNPRPNYPFAWVCTDTNVWKEIVTIPM